MALGSGVGRAESIVRAAVAGFARPSGAFGTAYSVSLWRLVVCRQRRVGILYGYSPAALVTLSVALQILAVVVLERIR
jgi:hypothetical protein